MSGQAGGRHPGSRAGGRGGRRGGRGHRPRGPRTPARLRPAGVRGPRGHQPWRRPSSPWPRWPSCSGWAGPLLDSRFFVARSVTVTGTHLVTGAEVRSAAAIPPGLPLIRVNSAMIAHRIERIRQVQSARVSRDWPDWVTIAVVERTPVLAVPGGRGYQLIDKYGVVVESSSRRPPALPTLELSAGCRAQARCPCLSCAAARRCTRGGGSARTAALPGPVGGQPAGTERHRGDPPARPRDHDRVGGARTGRRRRAGNSPC